METSRSHTARTHKEPPRLAMMNNQNKLKIIEELKKNQGTLVRERNKQYMSLYTLTK